MGIKHFWIWFKNNYGDHVKTYNLRHTQSVNIDVDMLAIDMNGIFHTCAQKVYKYGNYAPKVKKLLSRRNNRRFNKQKLLFAEIAKSVDFYRRLVNPKKRLLLCVDGVAGLAKLSQQRQRRFKSARDNDPNMEFDPNCITPGTVFMNNLTRYIDWYIRSQISISHEWKKLEVIFSNEKVPGEGEHKIINYLRKYKRIGESCCIHGMDADLIMLSLASPCENIYLLRDDSFNLDLSHVVDLGTVRKELQKRLVNEGDGNIKNIYDFVLMCYTVGNDFLPHSPGMEILSGGIDSMIEIYKELEEEYGLLCRMYKGQVKLKKDNFKRFLTELTELEPQFFKIKLNKSQHTFPDPILDKHTYEDANGEKYVNIEEYKKDYYAQKFPGVPVEKICEEYAKGLQWVLDYYTTGIPTWSWCYPWHYAPFLSDVANYMSKYKTEKYKNDQPFLPFQQLLCVLPVKSSNLVPKIIADIMKNDTLSPYFPEEFEVDLAGKRREWEGIVLIPHVNVDLFLEEYNKVIHQLSDREKRINVRGSIFSYIYTSEMMRPFRFYDGDITQNYCKRNFIEF